jgi:hypothetical protein
MILAFRTDNPGMWAFHCHNDFHASTGMMKQVIEAPGELRARLGLWKIQGTSAVKFTPATGTNPFEIVSGSVVTQGWLRNVQHCLGINSVAT